MIATLRTALRVSIRAAGTIRPRAVIVVLALAMAGAPHAQTEWTVIDLGTLGGLFGEAADINDAGHVVGAASPPEGGDHAFLWTPSGGMIDLGTLGGTHSWASAINNAGQVVGSSITDGGLFSTRAFLWTASGGMTDLGFLDEPFPGFGSSVAHDINDQGQIVGNSSTAGFASRAVLWTPTGGMLDLGTLGGQNSSARAINEAGQVVGTSDTTTGQEHAFILTATEGMVDLGTLGGSSSSAMDINTWGHVVGQAATASGDDHAFLWTPTGGMVDLGAPGGPGSWSMARGINDAGEVVGSFVGEDGEERGFYWTSTRGMVQLPTLTGVESRSNAINSSGQIAGSGDIDTGDAHAVIWTPGGVAPTPIEQIRSVQATIQGLVAAGSLKAGQATGLTRPLENALRSLEAGRVASACSQLSDFHAEVTRKVSDGGLTPADGQALVAAAAQIRAALGC